jgi:hypothetical protein
LESLPTRLSALPSNASAIVVSSTTPPGVETRNDAQVADVAGPGRGDLGFG